MSVYMEAPVVQQPFGWFPGAAGGMTMLPFVSPSFLPQVPVSFEQQLQLQLVQQWQQLQHVQQLQQLEQLQQQQQQQLEQLQQQQQQQLEQLQQQQQQQQAVLLQQEQHNKPLLDSSTLDILAQLEEIIKPSNKNQSPVPSFDQAFLKERHENVIHALYQGEQCKQCGWRQANDQEMQNHLDWHFQEKMKDKDRSRTCPSQSRGWFASPQEWSGNGQENKPFFQKETTTTSTASRSWARERPEQSTCELCHEHFDRSEWNHEHEAWMVPDAMEWTSKENSSETVLVHTECYNHRRAT